MNDEHYLLRVDEVAEVLRVSEMTVRRKIESGELDCIRIGKAVRIRPESVNKLAGFRLFKVPAPVSKSAIEKNREKQRARQRALRKLAKKSGGAFEDILDEEYEREGYSREEPPALSEDWRM